MFKLYTVDCEYVFALSHFCRLVTLLSTHSLPELLFRKILAVYVLFFLAIFFYTYYFIESPKM